MALLKRLSFKVASGLLIGLAVLSVTIVLLMVQGFRQAQVNATSRSIEGLATQGRTSLVRLVESEAQTSDTVLAHAENMTVIAAEYFAAMIEQNGAVSWDFATIVEGEEGQYYDPTPDRIVDVWIGNTVIVNDQVKQELQASAVLDALFPTLLAHGPDVIAIYYMSTLGVGRYYPVIDIVNLLPPDFPIATQPIFVMAAPENNPTRDPMWSPPHVDYVTFQPIATVSMPVYVSDEFHGIISADISLTRLIDHLNSLRPTSSGYSFLVDSSGRLVAAPPDAVSDFFGPVSSDFSITDTLGLPLESASNARLADVVAEMRAGDSGLAELSLDGELVLLAYAPLPTTGWSIATVAPLAEITAQAQAVSEYIEDDASRTLRNTLVIAGLGFVLMLAGSVLITRNMIAQPLQKLIAGTRAIAAGDLSHRIQITSQDELGTLASSFNRMAAELTEYRDEMQQQVTNRTRELQALFDVTAVASTSLDQKEVLEKSLAQVALVMNASYASIHLLENGPNPPQLAAEQGYLSQPPTDHTILAWISRVINEGKPLCGPLDAEDFLIDQASAKNLSTVSYLGVPMEVKGEVRGVLSVIGRSEETFSEAEVALLASIADQIGVAVENARLYQQAEELAIIEERQRLARELHDAVTQSLYSLTLLAETGRRVAQQGDVQQAEVYLSRLKDVGQQALKEMRLLVYELRPFALAQEGLIEALQHRLDAVEKRAGINGKLMVEGAIAITPESEAVLYRISQEALNNSLKHSDATHVNVSLQQDDARLQLLIIDNGVGFDVNNTNDVGGMGLANMRNRAVQIGATFELISHPGKGTEIQVTLSNKRKEDGNG